MANQFGNLKPNPNTCFRCGAHVSTPGTRSKLTLCAACKTVSICWSCQNSYPTKCAWIDRLKKVWLTAVPGSPLAGGSSDIPTWKITACKQYHKEV